jgi:hypothetical protein
MSHGLKVRKWKNGPSLFRTSLALMERLGGGLAKLADPSPSKPVLFDMLRLTKIPRAVGQLHQTHPSQRMNTALLLQLGASLISAQG